MSKNQIKNKFILLTFSMLIAGMGVGRSLESSDNKNNATSAGMEKEKQVYVIQAPVTDLNEFRQIAKEAARLKPFGKVEVNISELAEKGFYEIPKGRNFWYEYASYNPTPYKFFPDPKIAPFIPAEFVKKNRELLLAKAKILREYGLGAAFWSYEPNFIPEQFFEKYPEMMGPRVDHPRRGNYPAFAPCVSVKETQEMYINMVAELLRNVPEIHTFFFKTNDAGSGVCWSDWQYTGPNGPDHCKNISMGERIETLMNTFKKGAENAGRDISIYLTGSMFSDEEKLDIFQHLPDDCYFQSHNSDKVKGISSMIVGNYPVRGLFDPIEVLRNINSSKNDSTRTVFITFRASYDRACEDFGVIDKFIGMLVDNLKNSKLESEAEEQVQLFQLCSKWAGKNNADKLARIFLNLRKAEEYKSKSLNGVSGIYWGLTNRTITRPLVFAPDRLTADEEAYFMPFVFNPSEIEARMDYTDIHGAHKTLTTGAMSKYIAMLNNEITTLDNISVNAPEKDFLQNMSIALKIKRSIFRSIGNFAEAQTIRDRNAEKLAVSPHRPDKEPTWEGDTDLQLFNAIMRDELDNTVELTGILEDGGMNLISHAKDPKFEDTFLLGPNLIEQLRQKRKIMLNHWTDIEGYLTTPLK